MWTTWKAPRSASKARAFFRLNALVGMVFLIVVAAEVIFQGGFRLR
jgi:hypothetical protein